MLSRIRTENEHIYSCEMPAENAVKEILKDIDFCKQRCSPLTPEQIENLIKSYSDNEERSFILRVAVWAKLKKEGKI